jgi:hypothetical protein
MAIAANKTPVVEKLWHPDTKSIVGSILLAVVFSINMQITERIDSATTGGTFPWLGSMFINLWFPAACIFFGLTGALIIANFNPIIAVLTATHPLAPSFFFANMAYTIPFTFLYRFFARTRREISLPLFTLICMICNIGPTTVLLALWVFLLKLPTPQIILFYVIGILLAIPGSIMGYYFLRYLDRSRLME